MIRRSKRCSRAAPLLLLWTGVNPLGCSDPRVPASTPTDAYARALQTPPNLLVDPPSQLPPPSTMGEPSERVLSLTTPVSDGAALDFVRAYFRAITDENLEALAALLTTDATAPSATRGPSTALLDHWRARMNHLRYQAVAREALYDESRVAAYRFHDWNVALPARPARPAQMGASDVLVRVPIQVVRSGSERVFGDEIVLLLRRHKDSLAVAEHIEDFALQ